METLPLSDGMIYRNQGRRLRVLITGVTGLLGWTLVREGISRHEVSGLARHLEVTLPCPATCVDITNEASVVEAIERFAPDVIIHSAAIASVDQCQIEPALARLVNVQGTLHLLRAVRGQACRFIFISTDSVFDGKKGNYVENDAPCPINVYGRTKLEAEEAVLAERTDALVVRTSFYGWNLLPKESLGEWILSRLCAGQTVPGFSDARFSPLFTEHLARLIYLLIPIRTAGVLHVASEDGCSKYEFAQRLAVQFGFSCQRVTAASLALASFAAPRPADMTLAVGQAKAILERTLPTVEEGLMEFRVSASTVGRANPSAVPSRGIGQ